MLTGLYVRLATRPLVAAAPVARHATGALGLGRSRGVVLQLAALQGLDALAGGFIMQSLVAYWLHLRFGASPEAIGALFFGTNLLSALSFLVATRVAERFGLLNTMVFTHLPSNVLLLAGAVHAELRERVAGPARAAPAVADGRADAAGLRRGPRRARGARGGRGLHGQRARAVAGHRRRPSRE